MFAPLSADSFAVVSRCSNGVGGVLVTFSRALVTTTESLGTPGQTWRRNVTRYILEGFVGVATPSASNGTWTSFPISGTDVGIVGVTAASASPNVPTAFYADVVGAYRDYSVKTDSSGRFTFSCLGTGTSCDNVEVSVAGGAVIQTGITTRRTGSVNEIRDFTLTAPTPGAVTIRIKHNGTATNRLYIVGVNTARLTAGLSMPAGVTPDYTFWVRNDDDFAISNGAQDYAFLDVASAKWGGSFHGGETVSVQTMSLDGVSIAHTDRRVGYRFRMNQTSAIDWSGSGGGTMSMVQSLLWERDGLIDQQFAANGTGTYSPAYMGMCTTDPAFTQVTAPSATNVSANGDYAFGTSTGITQRNPTSGQVVRVTSTAPSAYPGYVSTFVRQDGTSYAKAYFGATTSTPGAVSNISWRATVRYDG